MIKVKMDMFFNNTSIISFLTGRLIKNANDSFRIIQVANNGNVILKDKANKLIYSDMSTIRNYNLNLV